MISPTRVLRAINSFRSAGGDQGHFSEDAHRVDVRGRFDQESAAEWRDLLRGCADDGIASIVVTDALTGDPFDLMAAQPQPGDLYRILLNKPATTTTFYFFDGSAIRALVNSLEFTLARQVFIADDSFAPFSTLTCAFAVWEHVAPDAAPIVAEIEDLNPQRFVRAIGGASVPATVGNVLIKHFPATTSAAFEHWRTVAIQSLRRALANEVALNGSIEEIVLFGPRKREIAVGDVADNADRLLRAATLAAEWVYDSGRDREARHLMFTYELAREWPGTAPWCTEFANLAASALDAAKRSYRLHLAETSKETWSALSDIRKSLADEIARIISQTRDLAAGLWRDLAVAAGAILARLAVGITGSEKDVGISINILMALTAAYLAYSAYLAFVSNGKFNAVWAKNSEAWRTRLYATLPTEETEELAEKPTQRAYDVYRWTAWRVGAAYGAAFLIVAYLAANGVIFHAMSKHQTNRQQTSKSIKGTINRTVSPPSKGETLRPASRRSPRPTSRP